MKRLITIFVFLVIGLWIFNLIESAINIQRNPVRAVNTFMVSVEKAQKLIADLAPKQSLVSAEKSWAELSMSQKQDRVPSLIRDRGIRDTSVLFQDKEFGNIAFRNSCIVKLSSYSIKKKTVTGDRAKIDVELAVANFSNLKTYFSEVGVLPPKAATMVITFILKRQSDNKWYIVDIKGELGDLFHAVQRYQKFR